MVAPMSPFEYARNLERQLAAWDARLEDLPTVTDLSIENLFAIITGKREPTGDEKGRIANAFQTDRDLRHLRATDLWEPDPRYGIRLVPGSRLLPGFERSFFPEHEQARTPGYWTCPWAFCWFFQKELPAHGGACPGCHEANLVWVRL